MKKLFAQFIFWIFRWKLNVAPKVEEITPSVMIAAPHTTNWDFIFAIGAFWQMEIPLRYFIKQAYTKSVFGFFFKWSGAIGVNQKQKGGLTQFAIDLLTERKDMVILVPAEGTRKRVEKWRTGFYTIAEKANVPIALGYLDYANKIAGVGKYIHPSGDFEKDMQIIQDFYKDVPPKNPELYNKQIY